MEITLLVILDSSDQENYRVYQETIPPFLEHFGIPYREIEYCQKLPFNFLLNR